MLLLMQGIIFLKSPVSILPSVCELSKILFGDSCHMIYVDWTELVIMNELISHPPDTMFIRWIKIRPLIWTLESCNNLIPNYLSVSNE